MIIDFFVEKNAEIKKKKEEAINHVKEGISKNDPSLITMGFDKFKRL